MMMRRLARVALTVSLALAAGEASAHIQLMSPTQRHSEQKAGPCGVGPEDARGPNVSTFAPGETITVVFDEHVNHPGHFRISFDVDGHDGFADPEAYDDFYTNEAVLLDEIADKDGGIYEVEVTLPDVECENCTLQVMQVMTDKPPFGPGGGVDFYWQCADLRLVGAAAETTTGEAPGTTGGGETGSDPGTTGAGETGGDATEDASAGETGSAGEDTAGTSPTTGEVDPGGTTTTTTAATATDTAAMDPDDDEGCGCRSDARGAGWLGLVVALAWRRRR